MKDDESLSDQLDAAIEAAQKNAGDSFAIPPWQQCDRIPGDHTYCLPPGRYLTTPERVEDRLVTPWNHIDDRRSEIWETYKARAAILEDMLAGPYMDWISGSFTSDKTSPGDIDVVSVIPHDTWLATPDVSRGRAIEQFQGQKADDYDWFMSVDLPTGTTDATSLTDDERERLMCRGFWDELWASHKQGGQRGYIMLRRNHEL